MRASQKTYNETVEHALEGQKWVVVDAANQVVGRLASQVASILRGKHKVTFAPHIDCGDGVIVINADKIQFTRAKAETKIYYKHTGFVGGMKSVVAGKMLERKPEEVVKLAVGGMLPKSALGRRQLKKLKVYTGSEHPHIAQQPSALELD